MKKLCLLFLSLLLVFFFLILISNRTVFVTFSNTSNIENVNFTFYYDDEKVHENSLEQSMFPTDLIDISGSLGFRKVLLVCDDFKTQEEIKIFCLFNNYLDFEISSNFDSEPVIISRKSWFPLIFE